MNNIFKVNKLFLYHISNSFYLFNFFFYKELLILILFDFFLYIFIVKSNMKK